MNTRLMCGSLSLALSLVFVPQTASADDDVEVRAAPISLMGCIQRETEYRREHNSGKGGFLGFGGGLGDEYVLINASQTADGAFGDCGTATGGEAYELSGSAEDDLKPFVGQRVAISGTRKAAEIDPATGRPTGGRQAGYDLRLFEVDVTSFRALAAPVQTGTIARLEQEPPLVDTDRESLAQDRVRPVAPRIQRQADARSDVLPRTASPLSLMGLAGLLSMAGVVALRRFYRPTPF